MNGSSGAKRATSVHALDQSAEIDGKKNLLALTNCHTVSRNVIPYLLERNPGILFFVLDF